MNTKRATYQRKRRHVDHDLQGRFITGLVLLQLVLLTALLYWLHADLLAFLEDRLYRVHLGPGEPVLPLLLRQCATPLAILVATNILLMLAAELHWGSRLRSLTSELGKLTSRTGALDFACASPPSTAHSVLDTAWAWNRLESARLAAFRGLVHELEHATHNNRQPILQRMRETLGSSMQDLPNP